MPVSPALPAGLPLGGLPGGTPHSVVCCLPRMRDVVGYEERHAETMAAVTVGYPRFVAHRYLAMVAAALKAREKWDWHVCLVAGQTEADTLWDFVKPRSGLIQDEGDFTVVCLENTRENAGLAKSWLQHTGMAASSRQAEAWLVSHGLLPAAHPEERAPVECAEAVVRETLRPFLDPASDREIFLARAGANAFYAAYQAVSAVQGPKRPLWIQLGWLYLDTTCLLQKMARPDVPPILRLDVNDLAGLADLLKREGHRVAGIVLEAPTNPLLETADLAAVQQLTRDCGTFVIADPSTVSVASVNLLPFCDLLVSSLTKYTAFHGDVMAGLLVVNPESSLGTAARRHIAKHLTAPHPLDLARLAAQIPRFPAMVKQVAETTARLVEFLSTHPAVAKVWWSGQERTGNSYRQVARSPQSHGGLFSFAFNKPLAEVHDRLDFVKGPSFGTEFSIVSPFLYLAHYDLVTTVEGRKYLKDNGLEPDLLRVSVGLEPAGVLIERFRQALA